MGDSFLLDVLIIACFEKEYKNFTSKIEEFLFG